MDEEAERALLESICLGGFGYKDIKERPVMPHLKQWLNPTQREILEKHAPERVKLSNGKTPKLILQSGGALLSDAFVYRNSTM